MFLVGLEDGLFLHARATSDKAELEEERRLCYVAITRAERFLYVTHAMKRRVYGEEMAAEPSQFLNELPVDLMEDLTRGPSWLSFARSSASMESRNVARTLRGETSSAGTSTKTSAPSKTYDSVESIAEFFRQRSTGTSSRAAAPITPPAVKRPAASSGSSTSSDVSNGDIVPGTHVRHPKYGRGLVLRREGTGDTAKLTVSFPGYGHKKLIEKYAGLEKA